MLRPSLQSQSWLPSGYVCHQCRHTLLALAGRQPNQYPQTRSLNTASRPAIRRIGYQHTRSRSTSATREGSVVSKSKDEAPKPGREPNKGFRVKPKLKRKLQLKSKKTTPVGETTKSKGDATKAKKPEAKKVPNDASSGDSSAVSNVGSILDKHGSPMFDSKAPKVVDEIKVPSGIVSDAISPGELADMPRVIVTGKSKPTTVTDQLRTLKERPDWGGTGPPPDKKKEPASFDTLREADRVSPEQVVVPANPKAPWGLPARDDTVEEPAEKSADKPASPKPSKTKKEKAKAQVKKETSKSTRPKPAATNRRARIRKILTVVQVSKKETRTRTSKSKAKVGVTKKGRKGAMAANSEPLPYSEGVESVVSHWLKVKPLKIDQPAVPPLSYGLDRVLFNSGVYQLQDQHSRVYNFDPYLQQIMPVEDFNFDSLKPYKTSSEDTDLCAIAKERGKKFIGSTSSMTGTLAHFHYLLSNWRPLDLSMLSRSIPGLVDTFTNMNKGPSAIFLRWKDGTYAIDADKEFDSGNVLMMLGKSMELLLTKSTEEYERYRKDSPNPITPEERAQPEAYQYSTMGDFLMRSQLDAYDSRLPGNGTFDLKTRAVVSVRMNARDYEPMTGYEIQNLQGLFESYEREYYDMLRATMLKYMLQARMGRMNGIFVAYHNVKRIFGFQYISIKEMDRALHGSLTTDLGNEEFKLSLKLLNSVFEKATEKFPGTTLRFFFETTPSKTSPIAEMRIFAEPMEEAEADKIQSTSKVKIAEFERSIMESNDNSPGDPSTSESTADLASLRKATDSAASPTSEKQEEKDAETFHKPLFVATLRVGNYTRPRNEPKTGWVSCPDNRPKDLRPDEEWNVNYSLAESKDEPAQQWALYEQCKARRRDLFAKLRDEGVNENGEPVVKKENSYISLLKRMSSRQRGIRAIIDKQEAGKEKVVLSMPNTIIPPDPSTEPSPKIESVEDYMEWMYK